MRIGTSATWIALLAIVGCSSSDSASESTTEVTVIREEEPSGGAEATAPEPADEVFVIAQASVFGDEGVGFTLEANGDIRVDEQLAGRVYPDGRLLDRDGSLVAQLGGGMVTSERGPHAEIADNVAELPGGRRLIIDDAGKVRWEGDSGSRVVLRMEPADSPSKPLILMLIVILML